MWPNSRLQAGEITDFIMPAWCSPVKACSTGHSHSRGLFRKLGPDRSPLASCENREKEVMFYCVPGSEVCVPTFVSEKAHSGAQSYPGHNGPWTTEHHSGFAKERLMFIIIAINGITVIVVIIHCLLEMSPLWSFETFHCFPCRVENSQLLIYRGTE